MPQQEWRNCETIRRLSSNFVAHLIHDVRKSERRWPEQRLGLVARILSVSKVYRQGRLSIVWE